MARIEALIAATVICLVASLVQVNALKCWTCSSASSDFCNDPFKSDKVNGTMKDKFLLDCEVPTGDTHRSVCRKLSRKGDDGKILIERRCYEEKTYGTRTQQECEFGDNKSTPDPKTTFCDTCTSDGCNGAASFTPFVTLVMIPAFLTKMFLNKS